MFVTDWFDCIFSMNFHCEGSLLRVSTWNNFKWMFGVFFLYEWRRSVRIQYIQTIRCTDIWMSSYGMQFKVCNFTFHHTHQSNLSSKSALHLVFWQFFFLSCWTRVNWKGARWGDVVKVILLWNIYSLNRIHLQESLCDWPP